MGVPKQSAKKYEPPQLIVPEVSNPPRKRSADEYNSDVPQLKELSILRHELIRHLEQLYVMKGDLPPIILIEHKDGAKDCFTNKAMRRSLMDVLGKKLFRKLVMVLTLNTQEPIFIPVREQPHSIFILGGSTNFTDDAFGKYFVRGVCRPIVEEVERNFRIRALGVCFGYQGLLEAFGEQKKVPIETTRQRLMFGYYPVKFESKEQEPWTRYFASDVPRQVCFTRSGYPRLVDEKTTFSKIPDITTLARVDLSLILQSEGINKPKKIDRSLPESHRHADAMVSMFKGKILGTAFHPEIKPRKAHLADFAPYVQAAGPETLEQLIPPDFGVELSLRRHPKPISDAFFIGVLGKWAMELAEV